MGPRMYSLFMMAAMMGGVPMGSLHAQRRSQPLTPEQEAIELERRKAKFLEDLEVHNTHGVVNKHWKMFEVHGLNILAYNQKNAHKALMGLMNRNGLSI